MNERLHFETDRLTIRVAHPDDAAAALDFRVRNREFLQPWLPAQREEAFQLGHSQAYMEEDWKEYLRGTGFRFLGLKKDDPTRVIVDINFSNVVRGAFRSCYVGYLQDEAHCGHGYMAEALGKCIWYMFAQENLHRIEANIMPHNTPSIKLVQRLGFQKEGYSPRYLHINGQWEDHERYALLNE